MGDTSDKSWLPKLPEEAKPMNDFLLSVSKQGHADAVQSYLGALKEHDFSAALKARDEIMDFAASTKTLDNLGKGLDVFDKAGKALEIAEAASRGDYEFAAAKTLAEVGDGFASGYLQSLGPGGVAIDFLAHQAGEAMSDVVDEYVQIGPGIKNSEADFNTAAQAGYSSLREYTEKTVREQLAEGRPPEEVNQWARDYLEAHGGIYKDLEHMDGMASQYGRLNLDQANIVDYTFDTWREMEYGETDADLVGQADHAADNPQFDVEVAVADDADVVDATPIYDDVDDTLTDDIIAEHT